MPKKTKRQKLHADKVRKPVPAAPLSTTVPRMEAQISAAPSLFTFTRSTTTPSSTTHTASVDHTELNAIRKDLTRTLVLAAIILIAELLLAFYLR